MKIYDIDERAWAEWVKGRPPVIQAMCERFPPGRLYRLKPTGQRVTMHSYNESGTVTVEITGEYNLVDFNRQVFGINPDDLEECDLPAAGELLGTLVPADHVDAYIDAIRPAILAARGITVCPTHGAHADMNCKVCTAIAAS